jgi:predicted acyltransferase
MSKQSRLISLDVLRGITVAGMILVNAGQGDTFAPLKHSAWNGMTPCDLVFPFFLFIMGISTYLSLRKFNFQMSSKVVRKIIKRTIVIFAIGLAINWLGSAVWGDASLSHLRIMAVLQRIALCYCVVSFFAILVSHRYIMPCIMGILVIYAVILLIGNGYAEDPSNIAVAIDSAILGENHLHHTAVEPEGLLGTLPAIAHTLIGFFCGKLMMETKETNNKVLRFMIAGATMVFVGYLLQYGLPLNKSIWSPSFVLMTCGLAASLQGLLMYLIDIKEKKQWTTPFLVFGVNPLFLYVFSEVMGILFGRFGLSEVLYNGIHTVVSNTYWTSFFFALTNVLICGFVGYLLFKKKIYIKI